MLFSFRKIFFITLTIFIFGPFFVSAQSQEIILTITPSTPTAGTVARAEIQNDAFFDFELSQITWYVNGQRVSSGRNLRQIDFVMGQAGGQTIVQAIANKDGLELKGDIVLKNQQLALVWEAVSSVPPFYKGKALPVKGSAFRTIAIPEIKVGSKNLTNSGLVFNWKQNGNNISTESGLGRNMAWAEDKTYIRNNNEISVEIYPNDKSSYLSGRVIVPRVSPEVLLYEDSPVFGTIYENTVTNYLADANSSITAEPYFFSFSKYSPTLNYNWVVNDVPSDSAYSYKPGVGNNVIIATIKNPQNMFQSATATFSNKNDRGFLQGLLFDILP